MVFIMVSIVESTFESTVKPAAFHSVPKAKKSNVHTMVPAPLPWGQFLVFIMVSIVESTFESTVEPAALHNIPKANPQYCGALRH